jgi:hypothetical protein
MFELHTLKKVQELKTKTLRVSLLFFNNHYIRENFRIKKPSAEVKI